MHACVICKGNIKQYRKIFIHPHLFTGFRHALNLHEECTVFEKKNWRVLQNASPITRGHKYYIIRRNFKKILHDIQGRQEGLRWSFIIRDRGLRPANHSYLQRFYIYEKYFKVARLNTTLFNESIKNLISRTWNRY